MVSKFLNNSLGDLFTVLSSHLARYSIFNLLIYHKNKNGIGNNVINVRTVPFIRRNAKSPSPYNKFSLCKGETTTGL